MFSLQTTKLPVTVSVGTVGSAAYPFTVTPYIDDVNDRTSAVALVLDTAGEIPWTADDTLVFDCEAQTTCTLAVQTRFFVGDELSFTYHNTMVGSRRVQCCCELRFLDSSRVFAQKLKGHLKCTMLGRPTDLSAVTRVEIHVLKNPDLTAVTVNDVYLTKTLPDLTVVGAPLVDTMGQNAAKDFAGKFQTEAELCAYLQSEYAYAREHDAYPTADYDRFGGYKPLHFGATGHFYTHFDGRRRWLVDPDGNAFFSNGICYGYRSGIYGMVDAFETLFESLPAKDDPAFAPAWATAENVPEYVKRNGREYARGKWLFNFTRANLIRAFGENWRAAGDVINRSRLKQWGFNTLSVCVNDYEDEDTVSHLQAFQMPYCYTLKHFPRTKTLLYRDFPDVFSEEYETLCREFAEQLRPFAEDEYFIGYFITNEPEWMFQKDVNPAERAFAAGQSATRTHLIGLLREQYGTVGDLNAAWDTAFTDFADLEQPLANLDTVSPAAAADFERMRDLLIDRYCEVPTAAIQAVAPHALNLGMRYSAVGEGDFAGSDRFDAFSFNCYKSDPSGMFQTAVDTIHVPFIVGEWHIGAAESDRLSGALVNATTQEERGKACAEYLRTAFTTPTCVGVHYFELNDQPLLGRFDGENMQIGFVNICSRPYEDCVKHVAAMNRRMYPILCGIDTPASTPWEYHYRF